MVAVEINGREPKQTWEIVGIYRDPNEDMSVIEKLVARTLSSGNVSKNSIIGGDLNLPHMDWKGDAEKTCGAQALVNKLVWENSYTQMVTMPTRGDTILDIYLLKPESAFISWKVVPGISDHNGVLLEADWAENRFRAQKRRKVPLNHKTDVLGLQVFLREKYKQWAENGSCVEEIWNNFKDIVFEGIQRYVPNKTLSMNPDPEYYNRDVKRLKAKVRKMYNQSKYSQNHQTELKLLYKELLLTKKRNQETFLCSALQNEGRSWAEFNKYVKRRRGTKENIPAIEDHNGKLIIEPVDKANTLNSYYASIFMIIIFWEMMPCGSYKNRRFGGSYRLHLQGARVRAGTERSC
jgi:hypothetical protein